MLSPFRVLDLTDDKGYFCGRILADLGADVIKIEPPEGDVGRSIGPFYAKLPRKEDSLFWLTYNANKRGITLNIESSDGGDILRRLVEKSDIVVESFHPGYLDSLDLGYEKLSEINPKIIMTSITPFGQIGPYKDYKTCDIVSLAMGGMMYMTGEYERVPVRISFPYAFPHASAYASVATVAALYYREKTVRGQYIDVSIQACQPMLTLHAIPFWILSQIRLHRAGQLRVGLGPSLARQIWQTRDGFVIYFVGGGRLRARENRELVKWMESKGVADDFVKNIDWESFDMQTTTENVLKRIQDIIADFFIRHTKTELYEEGFKRGVDVYPVCTTKEIAENVQLRERNYWVEVEHPELDTSFTYPGSFMRCPQAPIVLKREAPHIGQHNEEVYLGELGISQEEFLTLKQARVI